MSDASNLTANAEAKLLAHALYEIRLLLSGYIGCADKGPLEVHLAAHLAYALHNEALALIAGEGFDLETSLRKVHAIDNVLPGGEGKRYAGEWQKATHDAPPLYCAERPVISAN